VKDGNEVTKEEGKMERKKGKKEGDEKDMVPYHFQP